MTMKTLTLISLCIAAVSWSAYADGREEEFIVYRNAISSPDINKYVKELTGKLKKDLQGNPSLMLNETAFNSMHGEIYVAIVVDRRSSNYLAKVIDIKPKDSDESSSESSSEEEY